MWNSFFSCMLPWEKCDIVRGKLETPNCAKIDDQSSRANNYSWRLWVYVHVIGILYDWLNALQIPSFARKSQIIQQALRLGCTINHSYLRSWVVHIHRLDPSFPTQMCVCFITLRSAPLQLIKITELSLFVQMTSSTKTTNAQRPWTETW